MPHTKRSPEFQTRIATQAALIEELISTGQLSNSFRERETGLAVLRDVLDVLRTNTTDSPCIVKAADDEPIFVLRGQDSTSDEFVTGWSYKLRTHIANASIDDEKRDKLMNKVADALHCAAEMREYPNRKKPD